MLLVDQPVDFGILKADSLGSSRPIILIVDGIGIDGRPPDVVEGNFAAVDSVRTPENRKLLRDELGFYARLRELIGDHLADFFRLGITVRRKMQLDLQP